MVESWLLLKELKDIDMCAKIRLARSWFKRVVWKRGQKFGAR